MDIQAGFYRELPAKAYHSSTAISSTALVHALRSPAHFWTNYVGNPGRVAKKETSALTFGRAAHAFVLEHHSFTEQFAVTPNKADYPDALMTIADLHVFCRDHAIPVSKGMSKAELIAAIRHVGHHAGVVIWDEVVAEFESRLAGREIISAHDLATITAMRAALKAYEIEDAQTGAVIPLAQVFAKGKAEESFFWKDPDTGLMLRARTDWRIGNVVVDYKTTQDARPLPFRRDVAKLRYYMRAAMYLDGIEAVTGTRPSAFFLLAQEKEAPFAAAAYQINPDNLEFGQAQYKDALRKIKRSMDSGKWTGYSRQVQVITVPDYLYDETVQ